MFRGSLQDYYAFFSSLMMAFINQAMGAINLGLRGYFSLFSKLWIATLDMFRGSLNDYYAFFSRLMMAFIKGALGLVRIGLEGYFRTFRYLWEITL
eukprot:532573-Amorphochlora_amoeboformis.AAC.1